MWKIINKTKYVLIFFVVFFLSKVFFPDHSENIIIIYSLSIILAVQERLNNTVQDALNAINERDNRLKILKANITVASRLTHYIIEKDGRYGPKMNS